MRRGEEDARRVGEYLHEAGMTPDLAVASNARRARQTLECALAAFPGHVTHLIENTIYLATVDHLVDVLRQTPDKVQTLLAVGHNPGFAELADWLAGSGEAEALDHMRASYPTAALAILDFDTEHWAEVRKGAARLHRFVTPAALRGDVVDDPD